MNYKKGISLIALIFIPLSASAGVDSSGGGNAMVCRDKDQRILSAQVLDLFEAKVLYGLTPPAIPTPAVEQAGAAIDKLIDLNKLTTLTLQETFKHVVSTAHLLPLGTELQPINDSFPPVSQKGCLIEQLAAYLADGNLYINSEIWNALDETNKASLYVHEALYKMMRDRGETNSIRTRKIVGHLISGFDFDSTSPGPGNGAFLCVTPNSAFWNAPNVFSVTITGNVANVSFITLANYPLFDHKEIQVRSDVFKTSGSGATVAVFGYPTSRFESGDFVMIKGQEGAITLDVVNGLGNSKIKGSYALDCRGWR